MIDLLVAPTMAFALPDTEVVDLPRATNGIEYQLYVHIPGQCQTEDADCPTVYTLDAEYAFPLTATIVDHLANRNRIRPVVTVSIGYTDKSQYRPNRTRDYTPFPVQADSSNPNYNGSGKAAQFRQVIRNQVIPFVEKRWPVSRSERALVGHSYGGLFAANTLLDDPDLFSSYLIVSPSLWYGESAILKRLATLQEIGREGTPRVFLSVGSWEEQPQNGRAMVSAAEQLGRELERLGTDQVRFELQVLEDESHASVFPAALSNGLRRLYGPQAIPTTRQ